MQLAGEGVAAQQPGPGLLRPGEPVAGGGAEDEGRQQAQKDHQDGLEQDTGGDEGQAGQGEERPNIGFMIEQDRGVGITSLATHEEGAAPTPLGDRTWRSVLTFPDLPLHTGDYVISVFLFDESGLVTYDLWFKFMAFRFVSPTLMPGLVRLPHTWS